MQEKSQLNNKQHKTYKATTTIIFWWYVSGFKVIVFF